MTAAPVWVLVPGELAALGEAAAAHLADAELRGWWEQLDRADRALLIAAGRRTLTQRGLVDAALRPVDELAEALAARRRPDHVVVVTPGEGDRILLHCAADRELCVVERTAPERAVELTRTSRLVALRQVVSELAAVGGEIAAVPVEAKRSLAVSGLKTAAAVETSSAGYQDYDVEVASSSGSLADVLAEWIDRQLVPDTEV